MSPVFGAVLLLLPVVAWIGWWRLFRFAVESTTRALLAGFWTVAQFSGGLAIIGWLGVLTSGSALIAQAILTIGVWLLSTRSARPDSPAAEATQPTDRWVLVTVILLTGLVLFRTLLYANLLPVDGSDGSSYHLPALIEALNTASFAPSDSVVEIGRAGPKVVEMAFLWLMLGRSLDLVLFGQILFLPLGVAAVAALARWAGVRSRLAWVAGLLIILTPVVVAQLTSAYVDVGAGILLLSAIAMAFLYWKGGLPRGWGVVSAYGSIGFVAGSKYSLVIPALILGVLLVAHDLARRQLGLAHAAGVAVALIGSGWYMTTLVHYGNPLWPYGISALDGVFPNYLQTVDEIVGHELDYTPRLAELAPWRRPLAVWREPSTSPFMYSFDSRLAGMGPLWVIAWLPSILGWILLSIRRRASWAPLLAGLLFFVFWILQTYPWWTRFTWWLVGLGTVAAVKIWQEAPTLARTVLGSAVIAGGIYVLAFTSVQGFWIDEKVVALLDGADPVELDAGAVVAHAYHSAEERIAVPGLAWGSWNTYLRGDTFDNEVVVVTASNTEELERGLILTGATMAFVPGDGLAWPEGAIEGADACLEEVSEDVGRGQSLFRFVCG